MSDKILNDLKQAVVDLNPEAALAAAKAAVEAKLNPVDGIEKGLAEGMQVIVERFDEGELFMPQILIAAKAFVGACEVLQSTISKEEAAQLSNGKILFFSVAGDIHDIGKNIVKTMLLANNFEVKDLGRDVGAETVIDAALEWGADIVAGSALMTTTMPAQRDVINVMIERGVRDKFKVIYGGAPVTEEWVKEIGADAYGADAADAVKVVKGLLK